MLDKCIYYEETETGIWKYCTHKDFCKKRHRSNPYFGSFTPQECLEGGIGCPVLKEYNQRG